MGNNERREQITAEITGLKYLLRDSDYQILKLAEGMVDCKSTTALIAYFKEFLVKFGELVADRRAWRERINELEEELDNLPDEPEEPEAPVLEEPETEEDAGVEILQDGEQLEAPQTESEAAEPVEEQAEEGEIVDASPEVLTVEPGETVYTDQDEFDEQAEDEPDTIVTGEENDAE